MNLWDDSLFLSSRRCTHSYMVHGVSSLLSSCSWKHSIMTDIARKGHWSQLYECVICSLLMWQPFNNWANPTYGILLNSVHYALFSPQIVGTCRPGHAWALPRLFSENLSWRTVVRHIPEKNWRPHWKCANDTHEMSALDQSTASMSHIRHCRVLPLSYLSALRFCPCGRHYLLITKFTNIDNNWE